MTTAAEERAAALARGDIINADNPPGKLEGDDPDDDPEFVQDPDEPAAEEEDDVAGDSEEESEDEPGDTVEDEKPLITIPKARFDEANKKARDREAELQRRIGEMEKVQHKEVVSADVKKLNDELDDLNTKFEDLLMEGEVEKARTMRRLRDQKQNDLFDMRMQQQGQRASAVAVDQMRFDAQLAQFEAKHPAINPDSVDYNEGLAQEVADMMNVYKDAGWNMAAALNKAVHYVVSDSTDAVATKDPTIVKSARAQQGRKRVADAVKRMPPSLKDKGRDSDKAGARDGLPDVTRMSQEQFDKLTDDQLDALKNNQLTDEEAA